MVIAILYLLWAVTFAVVINTSVKINRTHKRLKKYLDNKGVD